MNSVLNLILSHQPAPAVSKMLTHWKQCVANQSILVAYGGPRSEFEAIEHQPKFFVDDPRIRTRDHQREFQSYTQLLHTAAEFLNTNGGKFQFVHFAEYDHVPLVTNLNERQIARLAAERADVLGFHVQRIDGTSHPHFLYHAANHEFSSYWTKISRRGEPEVVLSMFGTGSFWTREAFCAVAHFDKPWPIYMELYLPTLAHHLGFRVRDFAEQNRFVRALKDEICDIERAREAGAWTLHPVKRLWGK
jgi:catechol 2,3-dioxygenase-like lactoylglutathione lyase family enzyme